MSPESPSAHSTRDAFLRGAHLFNDGAFFEAHEAWEERWRRESDVALRRFLQGLIQIAAGFHKLFVAQDPASAARLLGKGLAKLEGGSAGISPAQTSFREGVHAWAIALSAGTEPPPVPKLRT